LNRRMRHGLQDSAECAFCGQEDETVDHLLVGCVFTRDLWFRLLRPGVGNRCRPLRVVGCRLGGWALGPCFLQT
jgi:hypothetical protein